MSESLRDRVQAAVLVELEDFNPSHLANGVYAQSITNAVFEAMAGARPCVTCGKGIGPAKVAKGYVQCYDCTRRHPVPRPEEFRREVLGTWTDD